ncbi:MAG: hypothetical protein IH989_05595, partial [Planctomycetes bacterium]|nr:hypothetical protein [Planctomycetota bacterium]
MRISVVKRSPVIGLALVIGCATTGPARVQPVTVATQWAMEKTPLDRSTAQLENDTLEHLAWAEAYRSRIVEATGSRTIENTLVPYNQLRMHLDAAQWECELFARVHPNADVREAAESGEQAVIKYATGLKLDRRLYNAFRRLDVSNADDATRFLVFKILRDFRRGGVDQDADTRTRIAELNE